MKIGLPLLLAISTFAGALDKNFLVFVGTYTDSGSKGIYAFRFDSGSGRITAVELAATSDNPSFLVVDRSQSFLYAANEIEKFEGKTDGSISVFAIDQKTSKLTSVQQVSSGGWGPVYLSFDKAERHLLVANYGAGGIAVLPLGTGGRLGPPIASIQHVGPPAPRPHAIELTKDDRFALVPDLALNRLFVYRFDAATGALAEDETRSLKLQANNGPRHLAWAPSARFVYVANETASSVTAFAFNTASASLREQQTISTLPPNSSVQNTAAEIALDREGKFLYLSNRGEDTIVVFRADQAMGNLSEVDRTPAGGKTPRTFAIDPTGKWVFVANQGSNTVNLFKRNPRTGRLTATSTSVSITAPAHVVFMAVH
jgi:6-phosphogluconolactonase